MLYECNISCYFDRHIAMSKNNNVALIRFVYLVVQSSKRRLEISFHKAPLETVHRNLISYGSVYLENTFLETDYFLLSDKYRQLNQMPRTKH